MKKYYLKKRFLLFFAGMLALPLIFIIALAIYTYLSEPDSSWIGFLAFLGILEIFSALLIISSVNLIISESGIVYNLLFRLSIKANWTQFEGISSIRSRFGEQEYLIGNTSDFKLPTLILPSMTGKVRTISRKFIVPIEWFAENWREAELGQQIKQYAPDLFQ
jgi:hypothetical protein